MDEDQFEIEMESEQDKVNRTEISYNSIPEHKRNRMEEIGVKMWVIGAAILSCLFFILKPTSSELAGHQVTTPVMSWWVVPMSPIIFFTILAVWRLTRR